MSDKNVSLAVESKLCCSCGVCRGVCPAHCIGWTMKNGMYYPNIDKDRCLDCGLCASVCPGLNRTYGDGAIDPHTAAVGTYFASYNSWSKDSVLRHMSASGGTVSTITKALLSMNEYDYAFCLDTYSYREQLKTSPKDVNSFSESWENSTTIKSRYLPVSHENAIEFMCKNRKTRLILIGTSCALTGICNTINALGLERDNFLLIGLFCDQVFNYNIVEYYENELFAGKRIESFHFKNKESGGWPGNMKFMLSDGTYQFRDAEERTRLKKYFMPECCLYCIDKLNVNADISVGDNFTDIESSELGSNSVIIRTAKGQKAWELAKDNLINVRIPIEKIIDAQAIDWRLNRLAYGDLKQKQMGSAHDSDIELNKGIRKDTDYRNLNGSYKACLAALHTGEVYPRNPVELKKRIRKDSKNKNQNAIAKLYRRARRIAARIIKGAGK